MRNYTLVRINSNCVHSCENLHKLVTYYLDIKVKCLKSTSIHGLTNYYKLKMLLSILLVKIGKKMIKTKNL